MKTTKRIFALLMTFVLLASTLSATSISSLAATTSTPTYKITLTKALPSSASAGNNDISTISAKFTVQYKESEKLDKYNPRFSSTHNSVVTFERCDANLFDTQNGYTTRKFTAYFTVEGLGKAKITAKFGDKSVNLGTVSVRNVYKMCKNNSVYSYPTINAKEYTGWKAENGSCVKLNQTSFKTLKENKYDVVLYKVINDVKYRMHLGIRTSASLTKIIKSNDPIYTDADYGKKYFEDNSIKRVKSKYIYRVCNCIHVYRDLYYTGKKNRTQIWSCGIMFYNGKNVIYSSRAGDAWEISKEDFGVREAGGHNYGA
ncbi:MAG: hypothetical protein ACI4IN_01405 [Eubacterium sp.]